MGNATVMEGLYLRKVRYIRGFLRTIVCMVKVFSIGLMEEYTREIGVITKRTARVSISGQMDRYTKENSERTTAQVLE
jgi:hypothetical protein